MILPLAHMTNCGLHGNEDGPDIDQRHLLEIMKRVLVDATKFENARIVDEDVDPPKSFNRLTHHTTVAGDLAMTRSQWLIRGVKMTANRLRCIITAWRCTAASPMVPGCSFWTIRLAPTPTGRSRSRRTRNRSKSDRGWNSLFLRCPVGRASSASSLDWRLFGH